MSWTFEATEAGYANMWRTAMLKAGADAANAETFASKIIAAESTYSAVQAATGVPWFFVGALHMRESGCNFAGVLHNGEHIIGTGKVTTLEPPNRGPFATWQDSAVDALKLKNMHRVQSWSAARMLFDAEGFNGLAYVRLGINSPYIWAGTNYEQRGKYVADHVFDPDADDTQLGVAAVLIRLAQKRPDIHAFLYPATPEKPPVSDPIPLPVDQAAAAEFFKMIQLLAQSVTTLNQNVALLLRAQGQTPVVETKPVAPVPVPPAPPASSTPVLQQPGVGLGVLGGVATLVLQALGVMGPSTGEAATTAGQLLPTLSAGIAGLGATGMFGTWGSALSTVLSMFTQPRPK